MNDKGHNRTYLFSAWLIVVLAALAVPIFGKNFGSIEVKGVGTVYVLGPDWTAGNVEVHTVHKQYSTYSL